MKTLARIGLWALAVILLVMAITATVLRVSLPQLNQIKPEILAWVKTQTGIEMNVEQVSGTWRNLEPSLRLDGVRIDTVTIDALPSSQARDIAIGQLYVQFDLLDSLWQQKLVLTHLEVEHLAADLSEVHWQQQSAAHAPATNSDQAATDSLSALERLLLRQFEQVSIRDANVVYLARSGAPQRLELEQLNWLNQGDQHRFDGQVLLPERFRPHRRAPRQASEAAATTESLPPASPLSEVEPSSRSERLPHTEASPNATPSADVRRFARLEPEADDDRRPRGPRRLQLQGQFRDFGSLRDLSGDFYLNAPGLDLKPWLSEQNLLDTGIEHASIGLQAWLSVERGEPTDGYLRWLPSRLAWQVKGESQRHQLRLRSGEARLVPQDKGWQLSTSQVKLFTDEVEWPDFNLDVQWRPDGMVANLSQLSLETLTPLVPLFSDSATAREAFSQWQLQGTIKDVRVASDFSQQSLEYSGHFAGVSMQQWSSLPEVHKLSGDIRGNRRQWVLNSELRDDTLPYGSVFKAPLVIKDAQVQLVWQQDDQGWRLWSDDIDVTTPDLQLKGQFRLDALADKAPFLSLYAQTKIKDAGQTWRYLPQPALGSELSDYLSDAIQAGQSERAKVLWYGDLDQFPYQQHQGVFQAWVPLTKARYQFSPDWPSMDDMQLDLLFHNQAMHFDSHHAKLGEVTASRVIGEIPSFSADSEIKVQATARGKADAIRDYMNQTPLQNSVGAALSTVQVQGDVGAEFQLSIPFSAERDPRAWGAVHFKDNPVYLTTPEMVFSSVSGELKFDNDKLFASGMSAQWLGQPLSFDLQAKEQASGYHLAINTVADWDIPKLKRRLDADWLAPLSGFLPWQLGLEINLKSQGFDLSAKAGAPVLGLKSDYPAPLTFDLGKAGYAKVTATGDQDGLTLSARLPKLNGQWLDYDGYLAFEQDYAAITRSRLHLGPRSTDESVPDQVTLTPGKKEVVLDTATLDGDGWLDFFSTLGAEQASAQEGLTAGQKALPSRSQSGAGQSVSRTSSTKSSASEQGPSQQLLLQQAANSIAQVKSQARQQGFDLGEPTDIVANVDKLTLGEINWHQVDVRAKQRQGRWQASLDSQEVQGNLSYLAPYDLTIDLSRFHLYIPGFEQTLDSERHEPIINQHDASPQVSALERTLYQMMPNLTLNIDDFWLQGYKVGKLTAQVERRADRLSWPQFKVQSGSNLLSLQGDWQLSGDQSHTQMSMRFKGKNNSELMQRFGISSGIQKAPFEVNSTLDWQGSPWAIPVASLNGKVKLKLGKGVVSDVSGAARLLGLFSLDSIIRKMQLDFSDVFDNGMAFDSITGSGEISKGVFLTNDIKMDALAGDMTLKGLADLDKRTVDAQVEFVPDITSGIPVLTAFAVSPPTALYVFAVSTVLSPVVEVFTKVNYEISGPMSDPKVKEISRSKGEYTLPKALSSDE